jgi:hypothetical protein
VLRSSVTACIVTREHSHRVVAFDNGLVMARSAEYRLIVAGTEFGS